MGCRSTHVTQGVQDDQAIAQLAHIPNTVTAISHLEKVFSDRKVPSNAIIVTMDVVALYPSIPIADGIDEVIEILKTHRKVIFGGH